MHFNWTQLIPGVGHHYTHVATLAIVSFVLILIGVYARVSLGAGETAVIPTSKFSVRGIFEFFTEYIGGLAEQVIGHHGRAFAPYFAAIFTYILFNNLVGIIPGMTPATENF
jgi:F-type H+-transporting ATPase subunit a